MPYCRHCKAKIERMDKEICPFCGQRRPLDGVSLETLDVTKAFGEGVEKDTELVRLKSKKKAALLCAIFGMFGVHSFYIRKPRQGLLFILVALFLIGGVGSLLFFVIIKGSIWAYLLPLFVQIVFQGLFALTYLLREDVKDGVGEMMR
ncbi:MAG: TM2 domain-containing protein [Methanomicrobia archaeon]|nr:TM2 domain-containing protein [Methanomicrobia archaeon]